MKLTTKLLKEMIQQELYEMGAGPRHIAVYADGSEEDLTAAQAGEIAPEVPREESLDGSGEIRYHVDAPIEQTFDPMADASPEDRQEYDNFGRD